MPEQPFKHISCSLVVLRIEPSQLVGDLVADELREDFLTARQRVAARHVIVDFQAVSYLSSAAFRPLLSLLREVRAITVAWCYAIFIRMCMKCSP